MDTQEFLKKFLDKGTIIFPHIVIRNGQDLSIFFWQNSRQDIKEVFEGTPWEIEESDRILIKKSSVEAPSSPWKNFEEFALFLTSEGCQIPDTLIIQINTLPEKFTVIFAPLNNGLGKYSEATAFCEQLTNRNNFLFDITVTQEKGLLTLIVNR